MARGGPLRALRRRRGVAVNEVSNGSSLVLLRLGPKVQALPQQQVPHLGSASTSCSTILSAHFQPCRRRGRQHSSDASRELKRIVDRQSFNGPFEEAYGSRGNYPSVVTYLPTALELPFPATSVDQSNTRGWNVPGYLDQGISSSMLEPVQPGSKANSRSGPTVSTISEHRQSPQAEQSGFEQRTQRISDRIAPSNFNPNSNKQVRTRLESPNVISHQTELRSPEGGAHLLSNICVTQLPCRKGETISELACVVDGQARSSQNDSHPTLSSYSIPAKMEGAKRREAAKMIERNRNPSDEVFDGIESQNPCSSDVELEADLIRTMRPSDVLEIREPELLSRAEKGQSTAVSEGGVTENSERQNLRTEEHLRKAFWKEPVKYSGSQDAAQWNGRRHMHRAGTTSEAIAVMKSRLHRGIPVDSYTYVKVLQMCLKHKDLAAVKQVHDCIIESGMDKNPYVASTLLSLYIKCGGLLDARRVFDELGNKNVIIWNVMIGGYANSHHAKSGMELFSTMRKEGPQPNEVTYLSILKACAGPLALKWGKEVHECLQHAGFESDLRVGSALVHMYADADSIDDARLVFNRMQKRDVVIWNTMIGALAQHGFGHEAYRLFLQMKAEGFEPNSVTYLSILNSSAKAGALEWVKEVHSYACKAGLELDVRVSNAFVHMYAETGSIADSRSVFDSMPKRTVVTWNTMIGGLAQHGYGQEAYRLFLQMKQEGFEPNAITYLSILNASASAGALEWVKDVHGHARRAGLESDLRVGNALVHLYAECGSIDDARLLFDRMQKRDVVTWSVMIGGLAQHGYAHEAYRLFVQMRQEGCEPDAFTYASILNASANSGALEWVKEVHGLARQAGLESDMRVGSALVHIYADGGSIDEARLVFDRMLKRDIVTWNIMIGGLARHGYGHEAYQMFLQMKEEGFEPNSITYLSILNASASAGASEWVKDVHAHACKAGLVSDVRVGNALAHMYAEGGSIDDAQLVFNRMQQRDVVTWNTMIGGLAQHGRGQEAYRQLLQMKQEGFEPDAITYLSILNASASAEALEWVKEVHGHALKAGLESDLRVSNALVHMYAEGGSIEDARLVFDRMQKRDIVTWNTMIGGLALNGRGHDAYRLFLQMKQEGLEPNPITYLSILNPSASAGGLEWVKEVHGHVLKAGLESDLHVGSGLVHMYAKSGSIDDARLLFNRMKKRDAVTWNVMIGGLAQHGCGNEALRLFREMTANGVKPDGTSVVAVLSACCHGGLVNEGLRLFPALTQNYGIEPETVHYNCMVDLLGRAGHLEEATLFISDMPVEPNSISWRALLGACRTCGNVELGELAANKIFKLEPSVASTYVLLSNIYAALGKWENVSLVRTMMQKRGVWKEPGRSSIEYDNKVHEFVAGDTSHPESKEIKSYLKELTEKLKAEGYMPDTRIVLRDISQEEKELALWSHSEKLAIAYGLMHIPSTEPILVTKNLRVCPDCHTATKLISKVTGREIIARDASRFHHFKNGVCSCGDYW